MSHSPLLTVDEVAERLGVSATTVSRLVRERAIPHVRVRHALRFDPADLEAWLDAQRLPAEEAS